MDRLTIQVAGPPRRARGSAGTGQSVRRSARRPRPVGVCVMRPKLRQVSRSPVPQPCASLFFVVWSILSWTGVRPAAGVSLVLSGESVTAGDAFDRVRREIQARLLGSAAFCSRPDFAVYLASRRTNCKKGQA